jgi:hypothetical protein
MTYEYNYKSQKYQPVKKFFSLKRKFKLKNLKNSHSSVLLCCIVRNSNVYQNGFLFGTYGMTG